MANTLKFGNGNFATKAGSTLCYDDQNGNFKPIPMDFTRASTATRVNKQGLIEVVKSNVPRIDYTDTTNGVLLLEKAATNLFPQSQYFLSGSGWSAANLTRTTDIIISPDGLLTGSKIEATGTGGHPLYDDLSVSNGTYTLSVFVKKGVNTSKASVSDGYSTTNISFDLDTGIVEANTGATLNPFIEAYNDGWFRVGYSFAVTASQTQPALYLYDANGQQSFTGNGETMYIWGFQLEQSSQSSSYIPTQGSATTRVAETASGAGNSEVFNDSEGVLFADIAANSDDGTYRMISLSDGSASNSINIQYDIVSNRIRTRIENAGAPKADISTIVSSVMLFNKVTVLYKTDKFELWVNGFKVGEDTSGIPPSGINKLSFDRADGLYDFYGSTKEIGYYNTILTDLELETLTSYKSWTSMVNELNLNIIYNG